jgi:hypothetical protein
VTIPNIPADPVIIYRIDTGEIVSTGGIQFIPELKDQQIAAAISPWGAEEYALIEGESDPETQYVIPTNQGPLIAHRPSLIVSVNKSIIIANGTDAAILTGLPSPCEIIQDSGEPEEQRVIVTGGGFLFTAENPGVYKFKIERFPFLPLELEFTAT